MFAITILYKIHHFTRANGSFHVFTRAYVPDESTETFDDGAAAGLDFTNFNVTQAHLEVLAQVDAMRRASVSIPQ